MNDDPIIKDFADKMEAYLNPNTVTLRDIHVSVLMGRLGLQLQPADFDKYDDFILICTRFLNWLRDPAAEKYEDNTVITKTDLEKFLKQYSPSDPTLRPGELIKGSVNKALDKLNTESLKVIEGLFPDRIGYFRAKEQIRPEEQKEVDEMLEAIREFAKERKYKERDLKLITSNYLELMNMLPDTPSRTDAQKYINTLLATKGIPMAFKVATGGSYQHGGTGSGAPPVNVNVIPLILDMFQKNAALPPPISDPAYLQTIIKSTLLALLQGTGLEAKIKDYPGDMMGLLVDGVKTGLLASIASLNASPAATSSSDLQTATLKSAVLSNIAALSNAVVPPNTGYQDAIAKAAVLSLIKTLASAENQEIAVKKLEGAINNITDTIRNHGELSKETIKMMLMVAQVALMSMAKDNDALIDTKIAAALDKKYEEIQTKVKALVAELKASSTTNVSPPLTVEEDAIVRKVLENTALNTGLITKVIGNDQLKSMIDNARAQVDEQVKRDKAELLDKIMALETSIADLQKKPRASTDDAIGLESVTLEDDRMKDLETQLAAYKSQLNALSTAVTATSGIESNLTGIMESRLQTFEREFTKSIDAKIFELQQQINKLTSRVEKLEADFDRDKEVYRKVDNTFKDLTALLTERIPKDSTNGGWTRGGDAAPEAKEDPVAQAKKFRKDLDEVKKNLRSITDAFGGLEGRYNKFKTSLPHLEEGKFKTDDLKDEKKILGYYSYLNEDGRKFMEEIKETVADKKKVLLESQKLIQKVLDADAANPMVVKTALLAKTTIEGNYDVEGDASLGILSLMDKLYGTIKTEYDEAYSAAKAASEGIKQQKEYAIREKQQQIVVRDKFGGGADPPMTVEKIFENITKNTQTLMTEVVKKTDDVYARKLNPAMSAAVVGEPTMFMNLYNNYLNNKTNTDPVLAARKLTEEMAANNLIPADVMKVSNTDKVVFVFVTIIFRMIALEITKYIVEKGKIQTLPWALGVFLALYALVFVAFVMFVNLDMYRLRILFNYINLHGNSSGVFMHLGLMWLFSFVIFMIMWNINFPLRGVKTTAISDQEKAELVYRLEVLTMIVWIFLVLMIIISQ